MELRFENTENIITMQDVYIRHIESIADRYGFSEELKVHRMNFQAKLDRIFKGEQS